MRVLQLVILSGHYIGVCCSWWMIKMQCEICECVEESDTILYSK